jgi:hypothetical protein
VGTSTGSPSRSTTARGGASSSRARTASFAPPRARISSQCPSRQWRRHARACPACPISCADVRVRRDACTAWLGVGRDASSGGHTCAGSQLAAAVVAAVDDALPHDPRQLRSVVSS